MIAWRHGMVGEVPGQGDPLIPQPSLTLPALRQAVAAVAPGRLPERGTPPSARLARSYAPRTEPWRVSDWRCPELSPGRAARLSWRHGLRGRQRP